MCGTAARREEAGDTCQSPGGHRDQASYRRVQEARRCALERTSVLYLAGAIAGLNSSSPCANWKREKKNNAEGALVGSSVPNRLNDHARSTALHGFMPSMRRLLRLQVILAAKARSHVGDGFLMRSSHLALGAVWAVARHLPVAAKGDLYEYSNAANTPAERTP